MSDKNESQQNDAAEDAKKAGFDVDEVIQTTAAESDPWAEAMAQQAAATPAAPADLETSALSQASPARPVRVADVFPSLSGKGATQTALDLAILHDMPVVLTVELGRTRMPLRELLQMGQGSIIELKKIAGEPLDMYVNGLWLAQGEVVEVNDKYGIRLTDIMTPSERMARNSILN